MENETKHRLTWPRTLLIGLATLVVIGGLIAVLRLALARESTGVEQPVDVLANSDDECVACHRNASPGIVQQFSHSAMAAAKVLCKDCHNVSQSYPGAKEHEGAYVLASPTTAMCERCHRAETAQYTASRHGLPAYVAVFGSKDFTPELMAQFQSIPEGQFAPDKARNAIAAMEGPEITRFACETCHNIGKPAADGSVGQCQKCHLRHEFSLEQARKPETCNNCHIGPDHPQWEIYHESPHGIAYSTMGYRWNWLAEPGMQSVKDIPAATCAVCHMSGFGGTGTTHDVGDRLTWYSFSSISERRPAWEDNLVRMQSVCQECHNKQFINLQYTDADKLVAKINSLVVESNDILKLLRENQLISDAQFDEPVEYVHYELWHHWGRTAKFGAWMQGPDYTQWHGAYEVYKAMTELKETAAEKLEAAGLAVPWK